MAHPVLKLRDGFADTSPQLRDEVRLLQQALAKAGHPAGTDGLFGPGTEQAVRAFQQSRSLGADGVVGAGTWAALAPFLDAAPPPVAPASPLDGFRGDLLWVHAREGYSGKAYWPGGESGVTLDPGVDLGFAEPPLVEKLYKDVLTPQQLAAVRAVFGIKGQAARNALSCNSVLGAIRVSRAQSDQIFPYAAQPYWKAIVKRFPVLPAPDTLSSVQTVMLSLAYNRGAGNSGLNVLQAPLAARKWAQVADLVGAMQQDHPLAGIRQRRRMEADLIRAQLAQG